MPERSIVIFLGAGFSTDDEQKLPVMSRFGDWSRKLAKSLPEWKGRREAHAELESVAGRFHEFQNWCRRATRYCALDPDNIEHLAGILESLEQGGQGRLRLTSEEIDLAELRRSFNKWVWFTYRGCPPFDWTLRRQYPVWPQEGLVKAVRLAAPPGHTTFVTTNYDIVLEAIAWRMGWSLAYPGLTELRRLSEGDPRGWATYLAVDADSTPVCKLHGSVNLVAKDPFRQDAEVMVLDTIVPKGKAIGRSKMPMDSPVTVPVDSFAVFLRDQSPAMIPPTYAKLANLPWLRPHWEHAFSRLCVATDIVFIGYSLPESDGHMRAFLQTALAAHARDKPPRVLVVDPSEDTRRRFNDLLTPSESKGNVSYCHDKLSDASIRKVAKWLELAARSR